MNSVSSTGAGNRKASDYEADEVSVFLKSYRLGKISCTDFVKF